ncbi:MAG: Uma2 family endonuclease [Chloroflexi bacterium]|nr:Uma2 family endonuclease [Chloroflexota bacterium]
MVVERKLHTVEDLEAFAALPENRDRRFELINGEMVEKVPTQEHGLLALKFGSRLLLFVEQNKLGRVGVEIRHQLPDDPHNALLPDISFYADVATPIVTRGAVPRLPDLVVEIKSPDDSYKAMHDKADYYLAHGVRMVVLLYPEKRLVEVRTPDDRQLLMDGDTFDGGDVLPGFTLAVSEMFNV